MLNEGSLSLSPEGKIIRFNPGLVKVLGYEPEEVMGNDFTCLSPPSLVGEHRELLKTALESAPVTGHKTLLLKKDGSAKDVFLSAYPLRTHAGYFYSYLLTISVGKTSAKPAIVSEEFQRIFRFSNDAVAVTDRAGHIIDVNQAFLETYGYKREEVLGKNPRVLKSQHSTRDLYEKMWSDILDPDKGWWRGEIINKAKDGREIPVLLSINAIKGEDGEIENFLGIAFDMTRQKELDRMNRMYIDYIIHDIRGPLTTIMVNSELLLMLLEGGISEKNRKKIEMILLSSQKLRSMTSDILDYSRAKSGGLTLKRAKASFSGVIKEALHPFENTDKRFYINGQAHSDYKFEDKELDADIDKVQRMAYNLLSNAFKNASEVVRFDYNFSAGKLTIKVYNDGKAITPQDAEKVFEAFYQTESGVKAGGAGLGLNIVKTFAEAHGGSAWVECTEESGVTFGFSIPV